MPISIIYSFLYFRGYHSMSYNLQNCQYQMRGDSGPFVVIYKLDDQDENSSGFHRL